MKKNIINAVVFALIISGCMKPNPDNNIPYSWTAEIKDIDSLGNEIVLHVEYLGFDVGEGEDGVFGSGDDGVENYTKFINYPENGSTTINYIGNGKDKLWFTDDDIVSRYSRFEEIGHTKELLLKSYIGSGPDGEWFTADDVEQYQSSYYKIIKKDNYSLKMNNEGVDGIIGTGDDGLLGYQKMEIIGEVNRYTNYVDPGSDKVWFTSDDVIGEMSSTFGSKSKDDEAYEIKCQNRNSYGYCEIVEKTIDGITTVTTNYFGIGDDNIWLSEDDNLILHNVDIFQEDRLVERKVSNGKGKDNLILTSDDVNFTHFKLVYDENQLLSAIKITDSFGQDAISNSGDEIWTSFFSIEYSDLNEGDVIAKFEFTDKIKVLKFKKIDNSKELILYHKTNLLDIIFTIPQYSNIFIPYFATHDIPDLFIINNGELSEFKTYSFNLEADNPKEIMYIDRIKIDRLVSGNTHTKNILNQNWYGLKPIFTAESIDYFSELATENYDYFYEYRSSSVETHELNKYTTKEISRTYRFENNETETKSTKFKIDKTKM